MPPIKTVVMFHGYAESPEKIWFPWLHRQLENAGVRVVATPLPNPLRPEFKAWFRAGRRSVPLWDENTVVVGHSLGGVLALRLLEKAAPKPIRGLVLVGSPFASIVSVKALMDFFDQPIDWADLKKKAKKIAIIQSHNDPFVPPDHALRYGEALGAKPTFTASDGHFIGRTADRVAEEIQKLLR
ncbi:hypothetical protein A3C96_02005 [Candidatus Uhrbacteria bacterium RIFCSPHIGHO2_02_FULL_60_10]|uniref:Serine hydrolase family protein n=1 Tax=Candidatus Uhrbacteria bacterium RIFCSPHIGHO2_02_FULL_60_10 TaxID=1802392 RepID=A0A1F7U4U6_9BACT|nr:MAG: hypothetical protein A3C96_02005 [Candidatus Uhrbacteria bacterium RIFCSPHIGHO2_02_FULL_60_10]